MYCDIGCFRRDSGKENGNYYLWFRALGFRVYSWPLGFIGFRAEGLGFRALGCREQRKVWVL